MKLQYDSILKATDQMAKGDLKIELQDDLGVFKPMGDSLEQIQQGFSTALEEEAKSQQMKTELITNVSHDIKTPLTSIINYVALLKREKITTEPAKSYIAVLDAKSQRLKHLTDDLVEASKISSGNIVLEMAQMDLYELIMQLCAVFFI